MAMEQEQPILVTSWLDEVPCAVCGEYIEKGQHIYPGGLCGCCHYNQAQQEESRDPDRQ